VHHLIAFVREPKSRWFRGQPAGVFFTAPKVSTDGWTSTFAEGCGGHPSRES
jgi:hypothetical protein